ncbi:MAG: BTAD domain-containing putative transcriptional regulator [Fimbriimonas sp.]|nr:BTAD domain-containing putative transcriptional regulator [Fimbriimonas sp.]
MSPLLLAEDRQSLGLDMAQSEIDVDEFRQKIKTAPTQAVDIYRGPLLSGLDLEWILPIRAELERSYVAALETIADGCDSRRAVEWLRKGIEVDPLSEPLQQKLMLRLAESGDIAGVTVAYRRFQTLLHKEVNAAPSEDTSRLYRQLLQAGTTIRFTVPEVPAATHRLPVPSTPLFGRERVIEDGCRMIADSRVVTLLGPGGVGKTRLAIAIGEKVLPIFPGGVWFVDLASLSAPDMIPQTVGQVLGLRERPDQCWLDLLVQALIGPPRLLILDNCEHLLEECGETVEHLMEACGNVSVLATSRLPINCSFEQRFPVEPLSLPVVDIVFQDWKHFSAIVLFEARSKRANPKFAVTAENLPNVVRVCQFVDAMPLGIEMAAATLAALSLDDIASRLGRSGEILKNPAGRSAPRHRSLNEVIDWSYSLLRTEDQKLLRLLSVFSGWWTLDHVEVAFGEKSEFSAIESVMRLVEASLVQMNEGRYALFETVRQFANPQLLLRGEESYARDRHLDCISVRFKGARDHWYGPNASQGPGRFESDLDNARLALDWSIASGAIEKGLFLVADVALVMGFLGLDGNPWLTRLLAAEVPDRGSPGRMAALRTACSSYCTAAFGISQAQAHRRGLKVVEEYHQLARERHDLANLCNSLAWLGQLLYPTDTARAYAALEEALGLCSQTEDRQTELFILANLGSHASGRSDYVEAVIFARRMLAIAEELSDIVWTAGSLALLGYALKEQCLYAEARIKLLESRTYSLAIRAVHRERCASQMLCELYIDCGELDLLAEELSAAAPDALEHGDWLSSGQIELISRFLAVNRGQVEEAATGLSSLIASYVAKARKMPSPAYRWAGLGLEVLAACLAASDRKEDAARIFGAAQAMSARDSIAVSPSIRHRWARLATSAGLTCFDLAIEDGKLLDPAEAVHACNVSLTNAGFSV